MTTTLGCDLTKPVSTERTTRTLVKELRAVNANESVWTSLSLMLTTRLNELT